MASESVVEGRSKREAGALTAVGAWIRIPLPYVPVTLQMSFVYLSGVWLGYNVARYI